MTEGRTYSIATFADFDAVPEERLDACLAEFATYVRVRRHMVKLLDYVTDAVVPGLDAGWQSGAFVWTDDGERCITVNLETEPVPDTTRSVHRLDWQDDQSAALGFCGNKRIEDTVVLHVDGDLLPDDYADQRCPVCDEQLKLVWDVRAVVRTPPTAAVEPTVLQAHKLPDDSKA